MTVMGRFLLCLANASLLLGCIDEVNRIPGPGQSQPADRLSEMGIFVGPLAALQPAPGVVAYDVNVPLYSDGAQKQRFLWLPPGAQIHATADRWEVPVGAYFVKNFYVPNDASDPSRGIHLVETRFLIKGEHDMTAATYVWNDEQTDAFASGGNRDVPVRWIDVDGVLHDQSFHVPGTSLCQDCHQNRSLGIRTRQIVHPGTYADGTTDQVSHLVAANVLDGAPPSGLVLSDPFGDAPLDTRARSYLDANCAHCHGDGGEAHGTGVLWDYDDTDLAHLPICRHTPTVAGNDHVIVPGHPEQSEFISRILSTDPWVRMPQGPSRVPDGAGVALLTRWVRDMSAGGCP
jgi:uncharacterized repeat protein (TIGR03806 family)